MKDTAENMRICIYGASGAELDGEYFAAARSLGRLIASGGHSLVFGGGKSGLMGACAAGALARGAEVTGVAPRFFDEPGVLMRDCSRLVFTDTMGERKHIMEELGEAFIVLPGGIGTFEEFFETLTLKQLGRHSKPMALLNTLGYYEALLAALERAAGGGFMGRGCLELFSLCATPDEALERAVCAPAPAASARPLADYCK